MFSLGLLIYANFMQKGEQGNSQDVKLEGDMTIRLLLSPHFDKKQYFV